MDRRRLRVGPITPVSHHSGYNNQPIFSADGSHIYYSWRPDQSQADILSYEIKRGKEKPFTCTSEEEYSPALLPDKTGISVVRVESTSVRRLWRFPFDGTEPTPLFPSISSVAYYAWVNVNTIVLFLTTPEGPQSSVLAIGNVTSGAVDRVATAIGPVLLKFPGALAISYVDESDSDSTRWRLMRLDISSRKRTFIAEMPPSTDMYAWLPDGSILAPVGSRILRWSQSNPHWAAVAELQPQFPLSGDISRIVVDSKGSRLLFVVKEK